jgi:aldehyde:ferredoxin oxidoreductase
VRRELMKGGYTGKLLFVDLTNGAVKEKALSEDLADNFVGGYGIGAKILYDMMKPGVDPLGPHNILGLVTGPLNATGASFGGRYTVVCKSPVTGEWNDANSGGFFGPELKRAGYDGVFVSGAADKPVYLFIKNGKAELRDAGYLWGKDCRETQERLVQETGESGLRAAVIGPAGEKQSLMACVVNDTHRAAGRGGPGAVMGSKNLKAVAVRGTGKVPVANPERVKELNSEIREYMKTEAAAGLVGLFGNFGTAGTVAGSGITGDSPVKNWGGVGVVDMSEESLAKIDSATFDAKYKVRKYACAQCPMGCGASLRVDEGMWPVGDTDRPEYETIGAFGTMALNGDIESIVKCNDICNRYGLDTISVGATGVWAIECYECGIFTKADTGGIELTWGNSAAIVALTQAIADQAGFGKILALGSAKAAEKLGKGFQYLQTVRGIELPMHDPRCSPMYARTYQYDPTPGRHVKGGLGLADALTGSTRGSHEGRGQADMVATCEKEALNCAGLCMFGGLVMPRDALPLLIEAVTGQEIDVVRTGKRIMNIRQAFNLREGQRRSDNVIPDRCVGRPPLLEGPVKGITVDSEKMADSFFEAVGWDKSTLFPSRESLEALGGLDNVIADLHG